MQSLWSVEHREIHNVLSVRRVTVDEDPLLHEGLLERLFDRDPEWFQARIRTNKQDTTKQCLRKFVES